MSAVDDIKSSLDLSQIAQFLGTDEQTANETVDQALAQLVGAMDSNAGDPDQVVGLSRAALNDHLDGSTFGDNVDINRVDTTDGEKIVNHLMSDTQIQSFSSGQGGQLLRRLLPILAPIVMGYLASQLQSRMGGGRAPQQQSGGGGLGDILGDLLGGGTSQQPQGRSTGGGLGDILGDLLGGGSTPQQTPQQAPQQVPQQPDSGGFQSPAGNDGGLRMDPGTPSSAPQGRAQAPAGGSGDLLGGLVRDILFGGRR